MSCRDRGGGLSPVPPSRHGWVPAALSHGSLSGPRSLTHPQLPQWAGPAAAPPAAAALTVERRRREAALGRCRRWSGSRTSPWVTGSSGSKSASTSRATGRTSGWCGARSETWWSTRDWGYAACPTTCAPPGCWRRPRGPGRGRCWPSLPTFTSTIREGCSTSRRWRCTAPRRPPCSAATTTRPSPGYRTGRWRGRRGLAGGPGTSASRLSGPAACCRRVRAARGRCSLRLVSVIMSEQKSFACFEWWAAE